jgi:hypothetical protein
MFGVLTKRNNRLLGTHDQPIAIDALRESPGQREALTAIAFFRRQRKWEEVGWWATSGCRKRLSSGWS